QHAPRRREGILETAEERRRRVRVRAQARDLSEALSASRGVPDGSWPEPRRPVPQGDVRWGGAGSAPTDTPLSSFRPGCQWPAVASDVPGDGCHSAAARDRGGAMSDLTTTTD